MSGEKPLDELFETANSDTIQSVIDTSPDVPAESISQISSLSNEIVSASAPVDIPTLSDTGHRPHSNSPSPVNSTLDEFKGDPHFGSFAMTQSLRSDPDSVLHAPRLVQRAISTSPRMEHDHIPQSEDNQSPVIEDPFFPFLNLDFGTDMIDSQNDLRKQNNTDAQTDTKSEINGEAMEVAKKSHWVIGKGHSEANIGPHHTINFKLKNKMNAAFSTSEVPSGKDLPKKVELGSNPHAPVMRNFSKVSIKGLRRKSSISSNLSFVGNYVLGSNVFNSPSRSNVSMGSDKINIVTDSFSIYPSILSLTSVDVGVLPFEDELMVPLATSHPRSVSAYNSRQNSRLDLEKDGLEKRISYKRSVSNISKGSNASLSSKLYREADEKLSLKDDEESDKITEVKSIVRPQPPKKQWQQTMPDLVEGPESETLTVQSTVRKTLAAAALAMVMKDSKKASFKMPDEEKAFDKEEEEDVKIITPRVYKKNLYVVNAVFFFSFASYMSLRNLQSSLNDAGGLGMLSLSCVYAFLFIGSIFTTTIVTRLRPKLSMLASLIGLLFYTVSNFYPSYGTLIPGACVVGFSLATIWTAQATYMANNASSYAQLTNQRFQDVLTSFHGIFFACFQVSQMVGGVISSVIFSLQTSKPSNDTLANYTSQENQTDYRGSLRIEDSMGMTEQNLSNFGENSPFSTPVVSNYNFWETTKSYKYSNVFDYNKNVTDFSMAYDFLNTSLASQKESIEQICGMGNCPGHGSSGFKVEFDPAMYYIMVSVFLSSMICSILILLFCLDPLEGPLRNPRAGISVQLFSVFKMLTNHHIICILPLMSYTLLQTTFIFGEFNKAFVTCVLGIHMIGYLTMCLSLFSSIFAFISGVIQKYLGPELIIISALLMHLVILIIMWVWAPSKGMTYIFFIIVAIWGAGDGMLVTQVVSLLGTLFVNNKEAAFSTYKMSQSSSAFLMFITGPYLCTKVKVIIIMTMNVLAMCGYTFLRLNIRRKKKAKESQQFDPTITNVTVIPNNDQVKKDGEMK